MENEYYVAESFRDLEKVGDVFEKDGKEYINVVLKSPGYLSLALSLWSLSKM